jgi:hypothetical protein
MKTSSLGPLLLYPKYCVIVKGHLKLEVPSDVRDSLGHSAGLTFQCRCLCGLLRWIRLFEFPWLFQTFCQTRPLNAQGHLVHPMGLTLSICGYSVHSTRIYVQCLKVT